MSAALIRTTRYFIRYSIVGVIGTGIDVGILYVLVDHLATPLRFAVAIAFVAAVTSNFILNKKWTFEDVSTKKTTQYLVFLSVSLLGLSITFFLMWFFVVEQHLWYIWAKLLTSCIVMVFNFSANNLITFREKKVI
ncbi:MAG: GtrA family protein [bacterium]